MSRHTLCGRVVWLLMAMVATAQLSAAVYQLSPASDLTRVPPLRAGDVVELASGTYKQVARWPCAGTPESPVIIRGVGPTRPIFDATGCAVTGERTIPRACLQTDGVNVVVEHLEFTNARNGDNGSGFRASSPVDAVTATVMLRDCVIHDCDMGVQSDGGHHLIIDGCNISKNGSPKNLGYSHNLYLFSRWATIRGSWIHDSAGGYNIKTRCHYVELFYNLISDSAEGEVDLVNSDLTEQPNSNAVMIGNVVVSKQRLPGANKTRFLRFGDESKAHRGTLYAFHNTFIAGTPDIRFLSIDTPESAIIACNNVMWGSGWLSAECRGPVTGSNNWIQRGGQLPEGFAVGGTDPHFAAPKSGNFRIADNSPCRDQGLSPLKYRDGDGVEHKAVAGWMYLGVGDLVPRGVDDRTDLGAFEVGGKVDAKFKRKTTTQQSSTPNQTP